MTTKPSASVNLKLEVWDYFIKLITFHVFVFFKI
jgi:hypothetical protein